MPSDGGTVRVFVWRTFILPAFQTFFFSWKGDILMEDNKLNLVETDIVKDENNIDDIEKSDSLQKEKQKKEDPHRKLMKSTYEWVEIICVSIALMLVVFMFAFRLVQVDGHSMNNTLKHGDRLIISDAFYTPKAGDIVVIVTDSGKYSDTPLIKRIIATEGQTIELDTVNWKIFITEADGTKHELDESIYDSLIKRESKDMEHGIVEFPYTVPEGCVFVMGDNRNASDDSRNLGAISIDNIVGRVLFRLVPFDKFGNVNE